MLVSLTTNQLRDLAPPGSPLAILADILDLAPPGETREITCPNQARSRWGAQLRALAEAGLVHVEDPGSWCRAAYQVRPLPNDLASWIVRTGAPREWPSLYPHIVDALRAERQDLDDVVFRSRLQAGIVSALDAERRPPNILPWLQVALDRAAPPRRETPGESSVGEATHFPRAQLAALRRSHPNYDRIALRIDDEATDAQ